MPFGILELSYIVAMTTDGFLIYFSIYYIKTFIGLKTDGSNATDKCKRLNSLLMPEYMLHFCFNLFFLFGSQWIPIAINVPLIVYHIIKFRNRSDLTKFELYDPIIIMNADRLYIYERETWIKLAFYLFSYFYYVYVIIRMFVKF